MTKQSIFQLTVGVIFLVLNAVKDFMPIGKMQLKVKVCELNIEQVLDHKSISSLQSILSDDDLNELNRLKTTYCKLNTKTNK
ncbi:hypothetical protein [Winogradskyella flava]|uniref:hypothetical protein n=1 Tax=Winogradskyella flava TaxID=1884876 RepID=UPI00248FB9AC|nr:hypothetical protein [Winogradskyella flava]